MPEQLIAERLLENLARLRLSRVKDIFSETVKTAQDEDWSYLTLLDWKGTPKTDTWKESYNISEETK